MTHSYALRAMGTDVSFTIGAARESDADASYLRMAEEVASWERQFSRFLAGSDVSRLTRGETVPADGRFRAVWAEALRIFGETDGVVSPLLSPAMLGYDRSLDELSEEGNPVGAAWHAARPAASADSPDMLRSAAPRLSLQPEAPSSADPRDVLTFDEAGRARLQPGFQLDFGSFLKGLLAERLARGESGRLGVSVTANLGGDLFHAGGERTIRILGPDGEVATTRVENEALATSGTWRRTWRAGGEKFHHIVDGQTGTSTASDLVLATIIAPEGALAEAWSTVSIILGSVEAEAQLRARGLRFFFLRTDGTTLDAL